MSVKNTGKFAMVQRILDDSGNYNGIIRARVTDDILLKKGQTVFFNETVEEINGLAAKGFITLEEAADRIKTRERLDKEYNQETVYSLRAGKLPATDGSSVTATKGGL